MSLINATYRSPVPEDVSFIYSSWLRGFRDRSTWASLIPANIYFDNHKKIVAKLIADSRIIIAANPNTIEEIYGYAVYQATLSSVAVIHYVYVKKDFRRVGLGSALIELVADISCHDPSLPMLATHYVDIGWEQLSRKWNVMFNPYILGSDFFYPKGIA